MNSVAVRLAKHLRVSALASSSLGGVPRSGTLWYSTSLSGGGDDQPSHDNDGPKNEELDEEFDDFLGGKPELQLQGVDPQRGWGFRGVHKAIICGKVGQAPVQKILRNGKNVTIFTVGTGGMFDQRIVGPKDLPKPAQWHRIAVHNDILGTYAVQQLFKNSSVYVEGDIETRVYNDSINGEVKSIPEICVRRDGRIRLIKSGESIDKTSLDELLTAISVWKRVNSEK
ncbi:Single-stranded DNA-binding protein, mitochondrial [Mucuna pruriens]|uniref:Single-stranded DNA-binding protein, mitochondrial n=1 Tax=Mucuna pruriens TaxID=157652 RepID=A0A371FSM2_MUCPR|nr:Single-stranded DNA-binding protein, mitochondrial [Mucuna pruriens]